MAGRGPAPKPVGERARRNAAERGEWKTLPDVVDPAPDMPPGDWHPATVAAWSAWWTDPASTQWGPAQQNAVLELLVLTDKFWNGGVTVANEMRLRQDALGLTEKGKRDLRWKLPLVEEEPEPRAPAGKGRKRKAPSKKVDPYDDVAKRERRAGVDAD